jgi:hypothetical protein
VATAVAKTPVAKTPAKAVKAPAKTPKAAASAPAAEPKERMSATDEEVAAAVAGTLAPRKSKGSTDQDSLTSRSENDRPTGRPLGISTGLPIMMAMAYVLQQNEKAPQNKKLTDEQIKEWFQSEFPGRDSKVHDNIQYCRRLYNAGRFTKGTPPKTPSNRFNEKGEIDNPTRGGNGRAPKGKAPTAKAAPVAKTAAKAPVAKAPVAKPAPKAVAPAVKRPVKVPV